MKLNKLKIENANRGNNGSRNANAQLFVGPSPRHSCSRPTPECVLTVLPDAGSRRFHIPNLIEETLTSVESERLAALERDIEAGQRTFIKMGTALAEIRDNRLYKSQFKTFEEYCREKWNFSRAHAYRLIDAAEIAEKLSPVGDIPSERVARELVKVPKDQCKEIYKSALAKANCEGRKLTANDISDTSRPDSRFFQQHESCPLGDSVVTFYRVHDFPISKIIRSSEVPNFKIGADPLTGIVPGQELHGEFITIGAAPLVIWLRRNGIFELITGRHRLDLAKRRGKIAIAVHIAREDQGFTAADAKRFDAHSNIRDGQGTTEDYAHYFKNSPSLTEANAKNQGLLDRAKGRDGWSLGKNASDDLYAPWMDKKITTEKAVAIVEAAPTNHNLQRLGLKQAANGKTISDLKNFIHAIDANAGGRAEQIDLLGRDDSAIKEAEEMGACASKHQREVIEKIRAVLGAAKRPELAAQEGVVVDDPQSVLEQVSRNKLEQERWQKWYLHPDLVAKIKGEIENQPRGKVSLAA